MMTKREIRVREFLFKPRLLDCNVFDVILVTLLAILRLGDIITFGMMVGAIAVGTIVSVFFMHQYITNQTKETLNEDK